MDGRDCSSSTVRSMAPAARCSSPHISDSEATAVPMKMRVAQEFREIAAGHRAVRAPSARRATTPA